MRMKMVCDDRTLAEAANEFLALKKAQKVRERTLNDYKKYIDKFLEQSQNSLDVDVLKMEILEYFADIPKTSPARFNHPYQYLHDHDYAESILKRIGYFSLIGGYKVPFKNPTTKKYKDGIAVNAHENIVLAIEEEMCYIVEQVEKQAESQMELPVAIKSVIHQVNRRIRKWWLIWKGGGRRWRTMLWVTSMGKQTASMRC